MPSFANITEVLSSGYSVYAGNGSLAQLERDLCQKDYSRKFILVDENTISHCLPLLMMNVPSLAKAEVIEIESGEKNKNIDIAIRLWEVLTELQADRRSVLLNLGGGVIGDIGGFVASTFKRGIDFLNVPTSLLAQVDASVGGKVGIDLNGLKNQIGVFKNPAAVYIYPDFLKTLPKREVLAGFAEMLKHGLVLNADHFYELKSFDLSRIDYLEELIMRSVHLKNEIVLDDPKEKNQRKLLNFGHTVGHALETYALENMTFSLLHGEAVAIGMICEAYLSFEICDLPQEELDEIVSLIISLYPAMKIDGLMYHRLIEIMRNDKKNTGNQINFTLLRSIGDGVYDCEVSADRIISSFEFYQNKLSELSHEV